MTYTNDGAKYAVRDFSNSMRSPLADETVLFCVLDADPITFFYREFQKIYGFYFKANISVADFFHMRWIESFLKDDPFPFHTKLEVYLSESASWATWGKRWREIAVIGLDDPILVAYLVNKNGYWMDAETASDGFVNMPLSTKRFQRISGVL